MLKLGSQMGDKLDAVTRFRDVYVDTPEDSDFPPLLESTEWSHSFHGGR